MGGRSPVDVRSASRTSAAESIDRGINSRKVTKGRSKPPLRQLLRFNRFDSEVVIHRYPQFLFAAEVPFGCLYRNVPEQELNLIQIATGEMT